MTTTDRPYSKTYLVTTGYGFGTYVDALDRDAARERAVTDHGMDPARIVGVRLVRS